MHREKQQTTQEIIYTSTLTERQSPRQAHQPLGSSIQEQHLEVLGEEQTPHMIDT
jgi:hypothetical protein